MGVQNLWRTLQKETAVTSLDGSNPSEHAKIAADVDGKTIAVDLSVWMMQARQAQSLALAYGDEVAQILKVVFERTIHWLRFGCTPVFVVEGYTPPEKLDTLRSRFASMTGTAGGGIGNRDGSWWRQLSRKVVTMLDALGLQSVQAEGEGEAMCAALNALGVVDACCTVDVDVLLFGATVVYRELQLSTSQAKGCKSVKCEMEAVRKALGIKRGGDLALVALARLIGGDYDQSGAERVGTTLAWQAVQHLLEGKEDDDDILERLDQELQTGPDLSCLSLKCTGCRTCGHDSHLKSRPKKHNAKTGCVECGTHAVELGGDGTGGCIAREFNLEDCSCTFHRNQSKRIFARVVQRASQTEGNYVDNRTDDVYLNEARQAKLAARKFVGAGLVGWIRRPDVQKLTQAMYPLDWSYETVRKKVAVLLMEWDVRQGPQPSLSMSVEFRPTGIKSVTQKVTKGEEGESRDRTESWTYLLVWERLPTGTAADQSIDTEWLKSSAPYSRTVRRSLVDCEWPELTAAFKEMQENKGKKKSGAGKGRAGQKGKAAKGVTVSEMSEQTQKMQSVMSRFLQQGTKTAAKNEVHDLRGLGLASDSEPESESENQEQGASLTLASTIPEPSSSMLHPQISSQAPSLISSRTRLTVNAKSSIHAAKSDLHAVAQIHQPLQTSNSGMLDSRLVGSVRSADAPLSQNDAGSVSRPKPVSRVHLDLTQHADAGEFGSDGSVQKDVVGVHGQTSQSQQLVHGRTSQSQQLVDGRTSQSQQGSKAMPSSQPLNDKHPVGTAPSLLRLLSGSHAPLSQTEESERAEGKRTVSMSGDAGERALSTQQSHGFHDVTQLSLASSVKTVGHSSKVKKASTSSQGPSSTPITKFFSRSPPQPPATAIMTNDQTGHSTQQPMQHAHDKHQPLVKSHLQSHPSSQEPACNTAGSQAQHVLPANTVQHVQHTWQQVPLPGARHDYFPSQLSHFTHDDPSNEMNSSSPQQDISQHSTHLSEGPVLHPAYALSPSKRPMPPLSALADPIDSPSPSKRLHFTAAPSHNSLSQNTAHSAQVSPNTAHTAWLSQNTAHSAQAAADAGKDVIDLVSPSPPPKSPPPVSLLDLASRLELSRTDTGSFQPTSLLQRFSAHPQNSQPSQAGVASRTDVTADTAANSIRQHAADVNVPTSSYCTDEIEPSAGPAVLSQQSGETEREQPDSPNSIGAATRTHHAMQTIGQLLDRWETEEENPFPVIMPTLALSSKAVSSPGDCTPTKDPDPRYSEPGGRNESDAGADDVIDLVTPPVKLHHSHT